MTVRLEGHDDVGDGRVRQYARTPSGGIVSIVVGRHFLGTAEIYAMAELAARRVERDMASTFTGRLRTEEDEP